MKKMESTSEVGSISTRPSMLQMMKRVPSTTTLHILQAVLFSFCGIASADDGSQFWLKYPRVDDGERLKHHQRMISAINVPGESETCQIIRDELKKGLQGLLGKEVPFTTAIGTVNSLVVATPRSSEIVRRSEFVAPLESLGREGYLIKSAETNGTKLTVIGANEDLGLLYGSFHFLRLIQTGQPLDHLDIVSRPRVQYRLLNHWDNLDGSIERGYAGKSLWKWDELPEQIDPRYHDYARANASIGINGAVLNNVNANPSILKAEYLEKIAVLANVLRRTAFGCSSPSISLLRPRLALMWKAIERVASAISQLQTR